MSVEVSISKVLERADQLELKGVIFSRKDLLTVLPVDESSINEAGTKWFLKEDLPSFDLN